MLLLSATDFAIRYAAERGTLRVVKCEGRFGPYWAIEDHHGVIEIALTEDDAKRRVSL